MSLYDPSSLRRSGRFKPNLWDVGIFILLISLFILLSRGWQDILGTLTSLDEIQVSLDPLKLPDYALRSSLRMFIAMIFSLGFTLIYGTIAAKTVVGQRILIPLLDILQSVPILGFLSFIVVVFMKMFPGKIIGMECAAIFAIFTSQAWNMTFSFYQSLRAIPLELKEVAQSFNLTGWQRFWQLEVPFSLPQLLWNAIMSMSAGWFFVVASEAISIGNTTVKLPGIGSYLALAIDQQNIPAIGWAMLAMSIVIVGYDQLVFRPLTVWVHKFKWEQSTDQFVPKSWFLQSLHSTQLCRRTFKFVGQGFKIITHLPLALPRPLQPTIQTIRIHFLPRMIGWLGFYSCMGYGLYQILGFIFFEINLQEVLDVGFYGFITLLRVMALLLICTVFWVPIGVWIGLKPSLARIFQPLIQFLASFPANLAFPLLVIPIIHYHLNPDIWLIGLMILGSQWYILWNVIAGAHALPHDFRELALSLHMDGWLKWRKLILPSIFPYYITGAITASGAAWNASIIAEVASWGNTKLSAHGIGSYLTQATVAGDYPRIILSISIMSMYIVLINRFVWRPLSVFVTRRFILE